jgi:ribose transport system permease protein
MSELSAGNFGPESQDLRSTARRRARGFIELQGRYPIVQIAVLAAVLLYGVATLPGLLSWQSIKTILVIASLIGLASVGQTFVILIGGFDLSLPSFMVASALLVTGIAQQDHYSVGVGIVIAVALCGTFGALAGYICHRFRVQPLIVTLGMGAIVLGLVETQVTNQMVAGAPGFSVQLTSLNTTTFGLQLPPVVAIWAGVALVATYFLHQTVIGRRLLATGCNPPAADYALVHTRLVWTSVFAFSGVASALVSLLIGGFAGTLDTSVADPYLFQSVVAVIVGGTIFGGPGDYARTVLGALFLAIVTIVLTGNGVSGYTEDIVYGVVLLIAVTLYARERRVRDRV